MFAPFFELRCKIQFTDPLTLNDHAFLKHIWNYTLYEQWSIVQSTWTILHNDPSLDSWLLSKLTKSQTDTKGNKISWKKTTVVSTTKAGSAPLPEVLFNKLHRWFWGTQVWKSPFLISISIKHNSFEMRRDKQREIKLIIIEALH